MNSREDGFSTVPLDEEDTIRVKRCNGKVLVGGSALLLGVAGLLTLGNIGDGDCGGEDELAYRAIGLGLAYLGGVISTKIWENGYIQSAVSRVGMFCCKDKTSPQNPAAQNDVEMNKTPSVAVGVR